MTFQTSTPANPAPGLEGDFCSANPRGSMLAGAGQLVSGSLLSPTQYGVTLPGVIVGRFGWARNDNGQVSNQNPGVAARLGFIHRNQTVLIQPYLGQASNLVPQGREITMFDSGDYWMRFAAGAAIGQKVFCRFADGTCIAAAAGATPVTATATGAAGGVFVGTGSGTNLTIASVTSGFLSPGDTISGTGVPAGTTIISQTSGTPGGAGVYVTSVATTSSGATITAASFNMIVSAATAATLYAGEPISGTNVTAGSTITGQTSGTTGGIGTYTLSVQQTFASTTVTATGSIESKWYVDSTAAAGELAMCSSRG